MKRKLGPLPLWQWALIGAAVGLATVLYRRGHAGAVSDIAAAATPSGAQYNPIDPTTGLPMSGGMSSGAGSPSVDFSQLAAAIASQMPQQQAPGDDLATTLSNFGSLESLLSGLSEIQGTPEPGDAVDASSDVPQTQLGTKRAKKPKTVVKRSKAHGGALSVFHDYGNGRVVYVRPAKAKAKRKTDGGHSNPGHHVTHHGGGKSTAHSSAPHNSRQHQNVAPPAHQRHDTTTHHSAQHPAARTPAHHATPAAHPPAKRAPVRRPAKRRR
jgi:hypothetical protein